MNKELYIVDDSPDLHFLLYKILKQLTEPYAVRFFADAKALYRHLSILSLKGQDQSLPSLIILDLNMPGMNGLQLLKLLRQPSASNEVPLSHIPVIIMSSDTRQDKIHQCYQAGANAYVVKPVEFEKMKTTLQTLCEFWLNVNHVPQAQE